MDGHNINAVGTEYGGMLRSALAGDPEALGPGGPAFAARIDP
jgi:hypothetical protein